MAQIPPTTSYRRAETGDASALQAVLLAVCEEHQLNPGDAGRKIWELLETPQTAETICRALGSALAIPEDACSVEVTALLQDLYLNDVIEISPDT